MSNPLIPDSKFATLITQGDGVKTAWEINFASGYLSKAHVRAFTVSNTGVVQELYPLTFIGPNTVQIIPAVPATSSLTIYRDTPKNAALVDYTDGSIINEPNLDTTARQSVFVSAEVSDRLAGVNTVAEKASTDSTTALATANAATAAAATATASAASATATANAAASTALTASQRADSARATASSFDARLVAAELNSGNALTVANGIDAKATLALTRSYAALADSATASSDAALALSVANGIDAKATSALATAASAESTATVANTNASTALSTANAIDAKATTALSTANTAKTASDQATADVATLTTALAGKASLSGATFTGPVAGITKTMIGLPNVDNTSDANKPVSTLQAAAIAAVVSSGTTANGTWVKFSDGTMICRHTVSVTTTAANTQATTGWTFPAVFTTTPVVVATPANYNSNQLITGGSDGTNMTTTSIRLVSSSSGITVSMGCIAIGRWL